MPTALDSGRRSPRKLLRAFVARLLGSKVGTPSGGGGWRPQPAPPYESALNSRPLSATGRRESIVERFLRQDPVPGSARLTTLLYVILWNTGGYGVDGWEWIFVILAVFADLASYGGSRYGWRDPRTRTY